MAVLVTNVSKSDQDYISLDNPFVETNTTDYIVKLEASDNNIIKLYLNSQILQTVCENVEKTESKEITLVDYQPVVVIHFFKFIYPGYTVELKENDDFKSFLDLCKRFNVAWFQKRIENFLIEQDHSQFSTTKFSLYFSLAKTFQLTNLNEKMEMDFIDNFKDGPGKEDYFMIANHFGLKNAKRELEKKMMTWKYGVKVARYSHRYRCNTETLENLLLSETYHYKDWEKKLISNCRLSEFMQLKELTGFSKIRDETIFQLIKSGITSNFEQNFQNDIPDWNMLIKFLDVLDTLYTQKIKNLTTIKPAKELVDNTSQTTQEIKPMVNPFKDESNTDVVVKVENTSLHLHSSFLSQCSPVFRVMLQGSGFKESQTKEIFLVNRKVSDAIQFFEFFYSPMNKKLIGFHYEELLSFSQEYQTDWITKRIEDHLVNTFDYKKPENILIAWSLVDQFELPRIKADLHKIDARQIEHFRELLKSVTFEKLKLTSKYILARKVIEISKALKEYGKPLLEFLDTFLGIENVWITHNDEGREEKQVEKMPLANPFVETNTTDYIVKIQSSDNSIIELYLNSQILRTVCKYLENTENEEITLVDYQPVVVIRFFKFNYPGYTVELKENDDFKSFLDLCKRFNVAWFQKRIENFLIEQDHSQFSTTKFSLYFSLAKTFQLTNLNEKMEMDFIDNFKDGPGKEDYFMIANHFCLKNAKRELEKKMMTSNNESSALYMHRHKHNNVTLENLLLCETYHYEDWKKQLISNCRLSEFMQLKDLIGFSKITDETIFQLIKSAITSYFEQNYQNDFLDGNMVIKFLDVLDTLYNRKFKNLTTLKPATEPVDNTSEAMQETTQVQNPFKDESNTDVVVKVENTSLHLHSSVLSQCSPVFRVMLQGSGFKESQTKEIFLVNRKASDAIQFFEFFYSPMNKKLIGFHYEELLSFSQEYQTDWITKRIEDHLVNTFDYKKPENILIAWSLVDQFELPRIKADFHKINAIQIEHFRELLKSVTFEKLKWTSKYILARKVIELSKALKEYGKPLLEFVDTFLGIENVWIAHYETPNSKSQKMSIFS